MIASEKRMEIPSRTGSPNSHLPEEGLEREILPRTYRVPAMQLLVRGDFRVCNARLQREVPAQTFQALQLGRCRAPGLEVADQANAYALLVPFQSLDVPAVELVLPPSADVDFTILRLT